MDTAQACHLWIAKNTKAPIHNKLDVNAYSAASQETAEKIMKQCTEYERKYAVYARK